VAKPCPEGRGEPELLWLLWEIKGVEAVEAGIAGIGSGCGSSYHGPTWKHRILRTSNWSELRWQGRRLLAPNSSLKSSTTQHILGSRISQGFTRNLKDDKDPLLQTESYDVHWCTMKIHKLVHESSWTNYRLPMFVARGVSSTTTAAGIKWLEMFTGLDSKVEVKSATRSRSPTSGSSDAKWSVVKRWILLQACHRSQNVFET